MSPVNEKKGSIVYRTQCDDYQTGVNIYKNISTLSQCSISHDHYTATHQTIFVRVRHVVLFRNKAEAVLNPSYLTKNCVVNCKWSCGRSGALFDAVEHASLHALLDLAPANHNLQHFGHAPLRIVLSRQISGDALLAHLRADQEAAFDLTLDAIQILLIRGRLKSLDARQGTRGGGGHCRPLEQAQRLVNVAPGGEGGQAHFGQ